MTAIELAAGYEVPDGWEWKLGDVDCTSCSATNQLHEQPPDWLNTPDGVVWECRFCGARNRLGGVEPSETLAEPVECGNCRRTFDNRPGADTVELGEDGSFTCPGCGVLNRVASSAESGVTHEAEATS